LLYVALLMALGGASYVAVGAAEASTGQRAGGTASASRSCYPPGSRTIAQDKVGRFWERFNPSARGSESRESWYVCGFGQGRSQKLPFSEPFRGPRGPGPVLPLSSSAKVSGRYVAFFAFDCCLGWVKVFDMVTGRSTFSALPSRFGRSSADSLVLKANGSVAWIVPGPRPSGPGGSGARSGSIWYVKRHDSTGTATVDTGAGIGPHSLAAGGRWLYWTRNVGSPPGARSAPFR
jgi:hypothetical protein